MLTQSSVEKSSADSKAEPRAASPTQPVDIRCEYGGSAYDESDFTGMHRWRTTTGFGERFGSYIRTFSIDIYGRKDEPPPEQIQVIPFYMTSNEDLQCALEIVIIEHVVRSRFRKRGCAVLLSKQILVLYFKPVGPANV